MRRGYVIYVVQRLYDIGRAILTLVIIGEVVGALYLFLNAQSIRDQLVRERDDELEAEAATYCTRWGFKEGTYEYRTCAVDLDEIREHERARYVEWP